MKDYTTCLYICPSYDGSDKPSWGCHGNINVYCIISEINMAICIMYYHLKQRDIILMQSLLSLAIPVEYKEMCEYCIFNYSSAIKFFAETG